MTFGLNTKEEKVFELIKTTKSRGRHSLRNAWVHLEKAWALQNIDPAIAMFRGLTAEEGAASALIYALRDRRYTDSNLLNPHDHPHKHSIYPFFEMLSDWFAESIEPLGLGVHMQLGSPSDPSRLKIRFKIKIDGKEFVATPDPPLNRNVTLGGKPISFQHKVKKLASVRNTKHVEKYIRDKANERNQLLYAAPQGYPHVESVSDEFFPSEEQSNNNGLRLFID